jgi:Fe2+ or Zn2+ uptake regulation protein
MGFLFFFQKNFDFFCKKLLTKVFLYVILLSIQNLNKEQSKMKRRSTKQREIVYDALMQLYHPTAEEVYEYLRGAYPTIGRATVFRNLAVLAEEGRIVKLFFPDEVAHYDANIDGHYHFVCRRCAKIIDLSVNKRVLFPPREDFVVDAQEVNLYGHCRECCDCVQS